MRPLPVRPIPMAYGLLGVFFITEPRLRQGKEASSQQAGPADRGSTRLIGVTFGFALVALLLAPVLNRWKVGHFRSQRVAWGGVTAMLAGLALRIWVSRVLGAFYTRTLRLTAHHHLITRGPTDWFAIPAILPIY